MNEREFIRIDVAGSAGALFVPTDLMAGMVEPALKTKLAGGVYHTATAFGRRRQVPLHLSRRQTLRRPCLPFARPCRN